jgi:hypothetical protein
MSWLLLHMSILEKTVPNCLVEWMILEIIPEMRNHLSGFP